MSLGNVQNHNYGLWCPSWPCASGMCPWHIFLSFQSHWTKYRSFFPLSLCKRLSLSPKHTSHTQAHPNHRHFTRQTSPPCLSFVATSFWNSSPLTPKTGLCDLHHTLQTCPMIRLKDSDNKTGILFTTVPLLWFLPALAPIWHSWDSLDPCYSLCSGDQ